MAARVTADGYALTVSTQKGEYQVVVDETRRADGGYEQVGFRRGAPQASDGSIVWSDPVATVTVRADGASPRHLEDIAAGMMLVDGAAYEEFLKAPDQDFLTAKSGHRLLRIGDTQVDVGYSGSLAGDGLLFRLGVGGGFAGFDASIGAESPFVVRSWENGDGWDSLVRIPRGAQTVTASPDVPLDTTRDAALGDLVLVHNPGAKPVKLEARYSGAAGREAQTIDVDPLAD